MSAVLLGPVTGPKIFVRPGRPEVAAKSRLHPRSIAVVRDQAGSNDRKGGILAFRPQGDVQLRKEQSRGEGVSCRCKGERDHES